MTANRSAPEFPEILLTLDNYKECMIPILKKIRPQWDLDQLQFKDYTTGKLNALMGVFIPTDKNDRIVIRMFPTVESYIDKKAEIKNMKLLNEFGLGPNVVAFFKNGFCYEFVAGENLTWKEVQQEPLWRYVAEAFAHLHSEVKPKGKLPRPSFFRDLEGILSQFPDKLPDPEMNKRFKELIPPKEALNQEVLYLKSELENCDSPVVFSHNDSVPENILWNKADNKITFIDFEFAAFNYQAADIAFHFCEFAGLDDFDLSRYPDREFQLKWIRAYLIAYYELNNKPSNEVTDEAVGKLYVLVNKFATATHFLTGILCLVLGLKVNPEFHFQFGLARYQAYLDTKDTLMNIKY